MTPASGILYLLPVPLADDAWSTLPAQAVSLAGELRFFAVENLRTARRFLKGLHPSLVIDERQFSELDKHDGPDLATVRSWLQAGHGVGVLSEAGCPGIADPGAALAAEAHRIGARVVPVTGPSAILLALMGSGLNGQRFAFQGYLPVKSPERLKRISALEAQARRDGQTQIFIETPYRNAALLQDLLQACSPTTRLCVASGLTGSAERIVTRTVAQWRTAPPVVEKEPTVFLFLPA